MKPFWAAFFSPRNLSFLVMACAVVVAVTFKKTAPTANAEKFAMLEQSNGGFMLKLLSGQAVMTLQAPDRHRVSLLRNFERQIRMLDRQNFFFGSLLIMQKHILLDAVGLERNFALPEVSDDPMIQDFITLYEKKQIVPDDSPIFKLPTGDLARLKLYDVGKRTEEKSKLLETIATAAKIRQAWLMLLAFVTTGLFLGSCFLVLTLIYKRPAPKYAVTLSGMSAQNQVYLFETAILYLFLMFPVGMILPKFLHIDERYAIHVHLVYIPLILFASVYYYTSHTGGVGGFVGLFLEKGSSLLREIVWGMAGFVAIFPIAVIVLIASLGIAGQRAGDVRFAHPVVFELAKTPFLVFVLAAMIVPVAEEIVFRMFLYGFFRSQTRIRYASLLTGMIFAVLHPQGWPALPYLTVLGAGLCLLREYRPGLVAPIVTHSLVNALAVVATYLVLSQR